MSIVGVSCVPQGWITCRLGDIHFDQARGIVPQQYPDEMFELYSVPSFDGRHPEIVAGTAIGSNKQTVSKNTVLLSKINPRLNRVWEVGEFTAYQKIASTEWIPFFPVAGLTPGYLCYYLQQNHFRDFLAANVSGVGGSLMRIKSSTLANYPFPLAPLPEQHRIVAEIETQFSRLDAGIAALKRVQSNLKRYRATVLQAACEGRLVPTEADLARQEGREYEPADVLLKRILAERRARWEADQLAKMEERGRLPLGDTWKAKYSEPEACNMDEDGLPEGWRWSTLDQLALTIRNGSSIVPNADHGIPMLRISAVRPMKLNINDVRWVSASTDVDGYVIQANDLLFTRYNGNPDLVGVCARVISHTHRVVHPDKLIRVVLVDAETMARFLPIVINNGISRVFLRARVRTTAGQAGVSGADIRAIPVPMPPLAEQQRIVTEVERRLSIVDEIEATVTANLKRAERLRQAILQRAFSGKLVPQDPNDEPASVLLEQIKRRTPTNMRSTTSAKQLEIP